MVRRDEQRAIEAVVEKFGGTWIEGDDPPDTYLLLGGARIAVEISTLTQHVRDENGAHVPRLTGDTTAVRIADNLDANLKTVIPNGLEVILVLRPPIKDARKTQSLLEEFVRKRIEEGVRSMEDTVTLRTNEIDVQIVEFQRASGKKVIGIVAAHNSSPDILANAAHTLLNTIKAKEEVRAQSPVGGVWWLVLQNDYFLADIDTYRQAFDLWPVEHSFQKILIVSREGNVESLL